MRLTTRALLLLCLTVLGCRSRCSPSESSVDYSAFSLPPPPPAKPPAPVPPAAVTSAASGMQDLAVDLYRHLASNPAGNFAFSPASISSAFALAWPGAGGETASELGRVLHLSGAPADALAAHGELLSRSAPGCELASGNSVWLQKGLSLAPAYEQALRQAANMEFIPADFKAQPQQEVARINAWVSQRTRERIKEIIPLAGIDPLTRMVLANAVYFKGTWKDKFEKQATQDSPFHLLDGQIVSTPRMNRSGDYRYFSNEWLQILEMPYECGEVAMVVLLPGGEPPPRRSEPGSTPAVSLPESLKRVEDALTTPQLQEWLAGLRTEEVIVSFPRFELNAQLPLKDALQELGVRIAFTDSADFRGMVPDTDVKIGGAFHKVWMKVDEEGTEAAAATALVAVTESVHRTHAFVVDRPFLFLIRDMKTGTILFMGRVADPR